MSQQGHIAYPYNTTTQGANKKMMMNIQKEIQVKLTKGLLDVIVLQMLKDEPMHGYQIITSIRKSYGVYFGPSTVYPLLGALEKKGYLLSEWNMHSDRPRKVYTLTEVGKNLLNFTEGSLNLIVRNMTNTAAQSASIEMQPSVAPSTDPRATRIHALAH
jgi:DNA-binding PadR family transcriptional regulator